MQREFKNPFLTLCPARGKGHLGHTGRGQNANKTIAMDLGLFFPPLNTLYMGIYQICLCKYLVSLWSLRANVRDTVCVYALDISGASDSVGCEC